MESVTAAGGVLFRANDTDPRVVLIFRRGVWDLPKGKLEEGESIRKCAVREVAEEIGLSHEPQIVGQLTQTRHEYEREGRHMNKTTHWFVMSCGDSSEIEFSPQKEEGIEAVRWISLARARRMVGYQNLENVLSSFRHWFQNH